jgi:hypothetical protein
MTRRAASWIASYGSPGPGRRDRGELGPQHHLVDRALRGREPPVDRERPGDVRGVVAVLAAGVDQEQVAIDHAPLVLDVVQDARVGPRGHDGRIGVARRALGPEDELDRRLHLVLVHAGPRVAHGLDVGVAADLTGTTLPRQLGGRAAQAQLVDDRARILDPHRRREAAAAGGAELDGQADHAGVEGRIAESVVDRRPVDRVLAQLGVELIDRVRRVGAVVGDRALHTRPMAGPDLHLAVPRTHEQDVPLLAVGRVEHRDGVRLVEPREEEEIGVLPEGVVYVVVAHGLRGGGDDGQTVPDGLDEAPPPLDERREILVRHDYLGSIPGQIPPGSASCGPPGAGVLPDRMVREGCRRLT